MTDPTTTEEATPSKGAASIISTLVAVIGAAALAYPQNKLFTSLARAGPVITVGIPLIVTIGGSIYTAASSPVPWLRKLMPWKPARPAIPPSKP